MSELLMGGARVLMNKLWEGLEDNENGLWEGPEQINYGRG